MEFDREMPSGTPTPVQLTKPYIELFQEHFAPFPKIIFYPASATDTSISENFPGSRVVYMDYEETAVDELKNRGYEARLADANKEQPENVDMLVLSNAPIDSLHAANTLKVGGYVLANNYRGNATAIIVSPDYKLVGIVAGDNEEQQLIVDGLGDSYEEYIVNNKRTSDINKKVGVDSLYIFKRVQRTELPEVTDDLGKSKKEDSSDPESMFNIDELMSNDAEVQKYMDEHLEKRGKVLGPDMQVENKEEN